MTEYTIVVRLRDRKSTIVQRPFTFKLMLAHRPQLSKIATEARDWLAMDRKKDSIGEVLKRMEAATLNRRYVLGACFAK